MRNASITARELFEQQQEKLGLRCISTRFGRLSKLEPDLCPF